MHSSVVKRMPISKRDYVRLAERVKAIFPPGSEAMFEAVMDAVEEVIPFRFVSDKQKSMVKKEPPKVAKDVVKPDYELVVRQTDRTRLHYERNKEWLAPQRTNNRRDKKASEKRELEEAVARKVAAMKLAAATAATPSC